MGLFNHLKEPVFLKTESEAQKKLEALTELLPQANESVKNNILQEIKITEAGLFGENTIEFELKNSHLPIYVLHDLFLEYNGLTAQIDYLIVSKSNIFVIECKNLIGDIEINGNGDFIRTVNFGKTHKKEGIYSPITQNRRHLELIKEIRSAGKTGAIKKAIFENSFYDTYKSVIVLSNPHTVLNAKYAKKEIKNQVIRADQLTDFLRSSNSNSDAGFSDDAMKRIAEEFLALNKIQNTNYIDFYKEKFAVNPSTPSESTNGSVILCPKCGSPMVKRKATTGKNAGNEFYGCSKYPKCHGIVNIDSNKESPAE